MVFRGLDEALAWVEKRLPPNPRRPAAGRMWRALDDDAESSALTRADAERALIATAMDYCWSIRHRSLPEDGPLRRLWRAHLDLRRLSRGALQGAAAEHDG